MTAIFDTISEPVSRRVTVGLSRIGLALKTQAWRGAGPQRLTPTQGQALAVLRGAVPGLRVTAVAEALGVSAATASDAVASLEAKGLVRRGPDPSEHRARVIALTPAGVALAERVASWPDFLVRAVDTLSPSEQEAFLRGLVKMIRALQEAGDIPPQRLCVTCRYFRPNVHPDPRAPHHCAFVDAPFGDRHLRLDCAEHDAASAPERQATWTRFDGSLIAMENPP